MLKTFNVAPEQDSVRTAFNQGQRGTTFRLSLGRAAPGFPEYLLKQDDIPVAILRGKEMVVGGEHFAVIPLLPDDWEQRGVYQHRPDNVPYWDGERRLQRLDVLLYNLSTSMRVPAALDDAVDAEDDEFFAGIPEVVYTGQQPEDFPLPVPIEWEPDWGPESAPWVPDLVPEPETPPPAKIYLWTFWYRGGDGAAHQMLLEATYEDAQRAWDALSPIFDMVGRRP